MDNKTKWMFGPRKTTNRPGFDMGNHENALNDCYIVDKKAMWRNFGDEHDARDVIRACAKTMGVKIGNCDPETFDFVLYNWLEDGLEEKNGVLALLYRLLWSKSELHTKLKRYEDAEEHGEIGRVPRWIPVTERLPERAGDYLCVCDDGEEPYVVIIQYNDEQEAFGHEVVVYDPDSLGFVETEFEKWSVTHWQLLPEPPEVE